VSVHGINAYGEMEVHIQSFLNSAPDRDIWSASRPDRFSRGKVQCVLTGQLAEWDTVGRVRWGCKNNTILREVEMQFLGFQPVA